MLDSSFPPTLFIGVLTVLPPACLLLNLVMLWRRPRSRPYWATLALLQIAGVVLAIGADALAPASPDDFPPAFGLGMVITLLASLTSLASALWLGGRRLFGYA